MNKYTLSGALIAILLISGCRGMESENRPFHPILNMDFQERYNAQEANELFENGMAMRPPVPGTVAKGFLREDTRFYTGETEEGSYVDRVPVPVTQALLERGRERYDIFCTPCHGQAGFGQGIIMAGDYGYTPAPTYHKETLRDTADGYLYDVIANGVRNMPGYAAQVPVADRWAIVAYIRALQRSQNAQRENVPPSVRARIEQTGSANMNAARNPAGPATGGDAGTGGDDAAAGQDTSAAPESSATGGTSESQPTASAQEASQDATADTAAAPGTAAPPDTATADTAGASSDTAAASGANVTEGAPISDQAGDTTAAESGVGDPATGNEEGGSFFGSTTFFILAFVVLPIVVLLVILVIAFRKDREH